MRIQVLWTHTEIFAREEGAIERTTRSSVGLLNLIAEDTLRPSLPSSSFLAAVVDGCAAPQHERLSAHEVAEALEEPALREAAMFEPPGAAAHDERRTTAFDALANAAEEEDSSFKGTGRSSRQTVAVRASRCSRWSSACQARGTSRGSTAAAAEGSAPPSPTPPRPALSKLVSLGSSKRLFEGSFSRSLKRIDSPSRPKTPKGAKQGSSKWSKSRSDFAPGPRGSQADRRSARQPEVEVQVERPPTLAEGSAEHRSSSFVEDPSNDESRRV